MTRAKDIWILGANGLVGGVVAKQLATRQQSLVLMGRDVTRLHEALADSVLRGRKRLKVRSPANRASSAVNIAAIHFVGVRSWHVPVKPSFAKPI